MIFLIKNWKLLAVLFLVSIIGYGGYTVGVKFTELKYAEMESDFKKAQEILIAELERQKILLREKARTQVREIYNEDDPTGCADEYIPDGMFRILSETDS